MSDSLDRISGLLTPYPKRAIRLDGISSLIFINAVYRKRTPLQLLPVAPKCPSLNSRKLPALRARNQEERRVTCGASVHPLMQCANVDQLIRRPSVAGRDAMDGRSPMRCHVRGVGLVRHPSQVNPRVRRTVPVSAAFQEAVLAPTDPHRDVQACSEAVDKMWHSLH